MNTGDTAFRSSFDEKGEEGGKSKLNVSKMGLSATAFARERERERKETPRQKNGRNRRKCENDINF